MASMQDRLSGTKTEQTHYTIFNLEAVTRNLAFFLKLMFSNRLSSFTFGDNIQQAKLSEHQSHK
jgi:hypothetical protein